MSYSPIYGYTTANPVLSYNNEDFPVVMVSPKPHAHGEIVVGSIRGEFTRGANWMRITTPTGVGGVWLTFTLYCCFAGLNQIRFTVSEYNALRGNASMTIYAGGTHVGGHQIQQPEGSYLNNCIFDIPYYRYKITGSLSNFFSNCSPGAYCQLDWEFL